MNILSHGDVLWLASFRDSHCVSIYMPTFWGMDQRQGPIRLRNLVDDAQCRLIARGLRAPAARERLAPLRAMVDDPDLWRQRGGSLAIFAAGSTVRRFQTPLEIDELVAVNGRFHVKPLLNLLSEDGLFYVLALSAHAVRLLQCTRHAAREVSLEPYAIPRRLDDVQKYYEYEKTVRFHATGVTGARRGAMFRRTEGYDQTLHKEELDRFVQAVAGGMHDLLRTERAPLVLACVDRLFPMYRAHNDYAHLADRCVGGNPDRAAADTLRAAAWEIVAPQFQTNLLATRRQFERALAKGLASNDVKDVVPAAHSGRVGRLMLPAAPAQWGRFDPRNGRVELHAARQDGDEDLADLAAVFTLRNSGTVYGLSAGEHHEPALAAIYRW
ncbi:MAG: hypothetical protein FWE88_06925 [Phycisphaerae bacterium]|nr:hypothetical protein [Phycisphaerae bacterium]